ncbi:MAG: uroporphyrinogen decarboxylase family protein [Candidatus Hodarchaeota archaeon]
MTSRERINAAISHKEPDMVPIDLGSTEATGISAIAYHNLKKLLGMRSGQTRIYDISQQLAQPEDEILDRFKVDTVHLGRFFNDSEDDWYDIEVNGIPAQFPSWFSPRHNEDGSMEVVHPDGTVLARMSEAALVFDQTFWPFYDKYPENISGFLQALTKYQGFALVKTPFDKLNQKGFWRKLRKETIEYKKTTDRALVLHMGLSLFEFGTGMRRMDKFLIDIIRRPNKVEKFLDIVLEFNFAALSLVCKYLGDLVDVIGIGDDLGENKGPFMNPRAYREIFKPRHESMCNFIKNHSNMKIFMHSCGSIVPFIYDFIEIGIDILNPVQINAKGMEPKFLKEEFGDDITFWGGGADTRNVITRKSPEEVKKHVTELLEIFAPGGGYIWNTVHNILPDVPPENIVAMFEALHEYNEKI